MKRIFTVLITLFLGAAMSTSSFSQTGSAIVMNAHELYDVLNTEQIKLEFDTPVTVTGYVVETGISIYATPYVSLSDEKGKTVYVTCVLPRTDALKLKEFKKGDKVVMQGNYYAFHGKAVVKKSKKIESNN